MQPSTELPVDDGDFRQHVSRYLPYIQLDTVYKYDEQNLRSCILELNVQEGRAQAKNGLQHAVKKHDQLDARREKRHFILRGAHKTQILATSIVNFLDSFSAIGEILKGIDARVGGILYGTLYVLLKTGHNKQRHEDLVTGGLKEFSVLLHQIHVYKSAHQKSVRMSSYITEVYDGIVIFAQKASIYYARPGAWRWLKAGIAKSPSVGVETQIETVRSAIRRVIEEANAIMSKRVEITMKNMTYAHNDSLASLRQKLHLTDMAASSTKTMDACSNIYTTGLFASTSRRGRTILLQEANITLLSTAGLLEPFQSPDQSSLLLLSGTNHHSSTHYVELCWLSPLALDFARTATGPVAFYSTQSVGPLDSILQRETIPNLLGAIIYQLLTWEDDFARQWRGAVDRAACTEAWQTDTLRVQKELLLTLLNELAERSDNNDHDRKGNIAPTTIVIDRPDAFCIEPAGGGRREWPIGEMLLELVESLLKVVKEARGIIKVVVIMHAAFSDEDRSEVKFSWERLEKEWKPPMLVCRRDWEQGRRVAKSEDLGT